MELDKFIEVIKKHGATGVLAVWLFLTNMKVNELQSLLINCYQQSKQVNAIYKETNPYLAMKDDQFETKIIFEK